MGVIAPQGCAPPKIWHIATTLGKSVQKVTGVLLIMRRRVHYVNMKVVEFAAVFSNKFVERNVLFS